MDTSHEALAERAGPSGKSKNAKASRRRAALATAADDPARGRATDPEATLVRRWHEGQGDRLPYEQCRMVVLALRECPAWKALTNGAAPGTPPDGDGLAAAIARLKRFGYSGKAAAELITFLTAPESTTPAP